MENSATFVAAIRERLNEATTTAYEEYFKPIGCTLEQAIHFVGATYAEHLQQEMAECKAMECETLRASGGMRQVALDLSIATYQARILVYNQFLDILSYRLRKLKEDRALCEKSL